MKTEMQSLLLSWRGIKFCASIRENGASSSTQVTSFVH